MDALTLITHRDHAFTRGNVLAEKLKELIPRQMFDVAIQALSVGKLSRGKLLKLYVKMSQLNVTAAMSAVNVNYWKNKKPVKSA